MTVEQEKVGSFLEKVMGDVKGHQAVLMAALGDRLGLFRALAEGPGTSTELAERTKLDERYVREWLSGMTCAEYIQYDPGSGRFSLAPEGKEVLAREGGPAFLGGVFEELPGLWDVFPRVAQSFREGGGVHIDAYPRCWWDGMERFTGTWFENLLTQQWIPQSEGVQEKLDAGAKVADVGCGRGRALVTLARAFPRVTAVGYDLSDANLQGARKTAEEAGVADRIRFEKKDVTAGLDDEFDVVTTFDAAHDLRDPAAVFGAIRRALRPGGSYLVLDFRVADRLEDNIGPFATVFYAFSLMYCMTTSLGQGGVGLGTCGLPESKVRELCDRAGFRSVHVVPFEDPFNVLYQAKA